MASIAVLCIIFEMVLAMPLTTGQEITLTYNLRENQENGTFVGNVARDSLLYGNISELEFQRLKFTFFTQGNPNAKLFKIDEKSSTIRTDTVIDREAICILETLCSVSLDIAIYMRDRVLNDYDLYKIMKVKVIIDDVNDNAPVFPQFQISLSVPESVPTGHVLLTSGAVDEDMGQNNSIQSYDLIPSNGMFGLKVVQNWDGTSDLGIIIKQLLDRESKDQFTVKVIAKDGGYPIKTGSVIIDITVTDVNDNRPVFLSTTYNISVYENIPNNKLVLQLSAIDMDEGINSVLTYKYGSRVSDKVKQSFDIDANTGRIYAIGKIDYEDTKQYQFMVEVVDSGSPSLSSQALVTIDIKDKNDNAPQININLTPEGTDISEAVDIKKFVAHVSVSDQDSESNNLVECAMSDSHFILESFFDNSYKVVLGKKLDYETQSSHNVTIICRDNGPEPLVNSSSFIVHVLDENDNFPEFSQMVYTGSIIENNDIGEEVLQVSAHDLDSGNNGRIYYSIEDDTAKYFSIDKNSGIINANVEFDREVISEFRFNVVASDYGNQPKAQSVSVIITVTDQNDHPPKFKKPVFFCYVLENLNPGATAGNISAIDNDSIANGELLFSIPISSLARDLFDVHPRTGIVTTKKKFDRESHDQYSFRVDVRDPQVPGFSDTANVTVYILDDNDNVPIIEYPTAKNFTTDIAFETTAGSVLSTIKAFDKDELSNAKIIYMLKSGNNRHLFNMNRMTGDLALSRTIRPDDSGLYKLEIMVSDSGNPPMTTRTKFYVNVAETNRTMLGLDDSSETDRNMLIVVSLVVVTLILGIAIVTAIFLIKRIDHERQRMLIMKTEEEQMYSIVKSKDSFSSRNSNGDLVEKNNQKEVSFSFEGEIDHNINSGSVSFTTFKSHPNQHSNKNNIQNNCLVTDKFQNRKSQSRDSVDELTPPSPIFQAKENETHQLMEILKKREDVSSESSGETGTNDSGRGVSDEEVSHRDSSCVDSVSHRDDSQLFHANRFYPNKEGRQSSLSFTTDHNSLNKLTPIVSGNIGNRYKNHCQNLNQNQHQFQDSHIHRPKYTGDQQRESFQVGRVQNVNSDHHLHPVDFITDESFRTGASSYCDNDDIETTTSGSYSINPDDLQSEIDSLFFNDVVV